ncbi:hypothetical protein C1H46_044932 [Malus baccata]|uniref:Uncharacterized protein n=1 Tax=Malus baccata TaxID=106549 RepID=A0A540K5M7_MALBA|nr:hypothetical protein C1H46_044932 [Malus baccata]
MGDGQENEGSIRDMGMLQACEPHDLTGSDVGDEISGLIFAGPAHGDQEAEQGCHSGQWIHGSQQRQTSL